MPQHSLNFIGCRSSSDATLLEFSFGLYQYSTTAFGPSVKFAFALFHYAIGGVGADLGIDLACCAAAGVSSQPISALPLRHHLAVCGLFTRSYFIPKFAASVPVYSWDRFPFFWSYLFFVVFPHCVSYLFRGRRTCFPVCGLLRLRPFFCCSSFSSAESQSSRAAARVAILYVFGISVVKVRQLLNFDDSAPDVYINFVDLFLMDPL